VLDGSQAVSCNNYGAALQSLKRCPDAETAYRAALQIWPVYLDALEQHQPRSASPLPSQVNVSRAVQRYVRSDIVKP
jgi:hypothetical protein